MPPDWFLKIILQDRLIFKNDIWFSSSANGHANWSFTEEWKEHLNTRQIKTWDMTAVERLQNFFKETKTNPDLLAGMLVLDAGCGNGQLTEAISTTKANVVGIDVQIYLPPGNEQVQFVCDDFDDPPFKSRSFDIIIANGSIHHTKDTFHSFKKLGGLVKENGKLYVWVYKKQTGIRRALLWALDLSRFFISRMPSALQRFTVNVLTWFFYLLSRIRKGENTNRTIDEIRINNYDAFTPRYRHYQTVEQVTKWYNDCGFHDVEVTHVNNKYGFGILGIKNSGSTK